MSQLLTLVEAISIKLANCTTNFTPAEKFGIVNGAELNQAFIAVPYKDD